ncbi:MAG: hypothetical protein J6N55_12375 [Anaerovibrio sp.]|nr:hypothetical protein [Anaerovibrio sp.]
MANKGYGSAHYNQNHNQKQTIHGEVTSLQKIQTTESSFNDYIVFITWKPCA